MIQFASFYVRRGRASGQKRAKELIALPKALHGIALWKKDIHSYVIGVF